MIWSGRDTQTEPNRFLLAVLIFVCVTLLCRAIDWAVVVYYGGWSS